MAIVPKITPSVAERPILQQPITVRASPDDMGAQIGSGMQNLAAGAMQASEAFAQLRELEDNAEVKTRVNKIAEWDMEAQYGENGFLTLRGKNATGAYDKYLGDLKMKIAEFGAQLPPSALASYKQASQSRLLSSQQTALIHRSRENVAWINEASTSRLATLSDEALLAWSRPGAVQKSVTLGIAEIQQMGSLQGWDEETLAQKSQEFQSNILRGVGLQMSQDDPIKAAEFYVQNQDKFTAADGYELANHLVPMVKDAAARDAAAQGPRMPLAQPGSSAADVIRMFEGEETVAYPDTGGHDGKQFSGWRVGYGSDTVTRADGTVERVTKDTVITQADAKRDLDRRLVDFQQGIVDKVGAHAWAGLDGSTRNALSSVAYNYGSLPGTVAAAVITGDRQAIATAIEGLAGHNGGVNAGRRQIEAEMVRKGTGAGLVFSERVENLLGALPENMAIEIRETAADDLARSRAAEATAIRAQSAAARDTLALGISTGEVRSDQEILQHPDLDDGDKSSLIDKLHTAQSATAGARTYSVDLAAGNARTLNPYSKDDVSLADKTFQMTMEALPSDMPEDQKVAASIGFVHDTGIVPETMIASVRQGLASTDPRSVGQAMQYSASLMQAAPMAVGHLSNAKEIETAAATYAALVDGRGMSLDQAAAYVVEQRKPENIAKAEVLNTIWTQAVKDNRFSINDVLAGFGDNWMPGGPVAGITPYQQNAVLGDYLNAAETALRGPANGDVDIAKTLALTEMKRSYAVSTISGTEVVTKYPPELTYPAIGGDHSYIRDLALSDARSVAPDATNVMLSWVPETSQDIRSNKPPRYRLSYVKPDGIIEDIPGLFKVDAGETEMLAKFDSEERQVKFELERAYKAGLQAHQQNPLVWGLENTAAGGGFIRPPSQEQIVPNYDLYQSRLFDIDARRRAMLGQNDTAGTTVPTLEQIDPRAANMAAEQQWNEQNAATFGPLGGAPR